MNPTPGKPNIFGDSTTAVLSTCIVLGIFLWVSSAVIIFVVGGSNAGLAASGQFGDSFGALNCLFSGLAAAGAFAAFRSQQVEIRRLDDDRRKDEEQQRAEERQRQHDRIIERFHELLRHWRQSVAQIDFRYGSENRQGVLALMGMEHSLLGHFDSLESVFKSLRAGTKIIFAHDGVLLNCRKNRPLDKLNECLPIDTVRSAFQDFHEKHVGGQLGHVFRIVREILTTIDDTSQLGDAVTGHLTRAFKVLLSDPELHLLVYWGLSDRATPRCRELLDDLYIFEGLVEKKSDRISIRIPELAYYPRTYSEWCQRHPDGEIAGGDEASRWFTSGENTTA